MTARLILPALLCVLAELAPQAPRAAECPTLPDLLGVPPHVTFFTANLFDLQLQATGDWNGDGHLDVALGWYNSQWVGYPEGIYIYFGPWAPGTKIEVGPVPADLLVLRDSPPFHFHFFRVASLGADLDGDDIEDLVITSRYTLSAGSSDTDGVTGIYFGRRDWPAVLDPSATPPDVLIRGRLPGPGEWRGDMVVAETAGDLDGDSVTDLVLAPDYGSSPRAYVIRGRKRDAWPASIDLNVTEADVTIVDLGSDLGFRRDYQDIWGPVASIGDLTGDGVPDLALGAPAAASRSGDSRAGRVYVLAGPLEPRISLPDGAGHALYGPYRRTEWGSWVELADVTGDGVDDLVAASRRDIGHGDWRGGVVVVPGGVGLPDEWDAARESFGSLITTAARRPGSRGSLWRLLATDLAGDGVADILLYDSEVVDILSGRSTWPSEIDLAVVPPTARLPVSHLRDTVARPGRGWDLETFPPCLRPVVLRTSLDLDPPGLLAGSSRERELESNPSRFRVDLVPPPDTDGDGVGDWDDQDDDGDGIPDIRDRCRLLADPGQADRDGDGVGDACDLCPGAFDPGQLDGDSDGLGDACDVCPVVPDPDQMDRDSDGLGDACDLCPDLKAADNRDPDGDRLGSPCDPDDDNDEVPDEKDPCPLTPPVGDEHVDGDGDGQADACDNCPADSNRGQEDRDGDGLGDACDAGPTGVVTVHPPGDADALRAALDGARTTRDAVLLPPGTYVGPFTVPDGVSLLGSGRDVTILQGNGRGVIQLGDGAWLEGVTVTGGGDWYGVTNSGPFAATIRDCRVTGNRGAFSPGVGVAGRLVLLENIIEDNGSGAELILPASGVHGNLIRNNDDRGLYMRGLDRIGPGYPTSPWSHSITRNVITGNGDDGLHVFLDLDYWFSDLPHLLWPVISNNVISGNRGDGLRAGTYVFDPSYYPYSLGQETDPITAPTPGDENEPDQANEQAVEIDGTPAIPRPATITGNVITGNLGHGVALHRYGATPSNLPFAISHSLVRDDWWPPDIGGLRNVLGNKDEDPRFRNEAAGDFRPAPLSPLIDSGPLLGADGRDIGGYPVPLDGDLDGVARADMGAWEERGEVEGLAFATDGVTLTWDDRIDAGSFNLYRGDAEGLRVGRGLTQDPAEVAGAERWCGLTTTSFPDSDTPDGPGRIFHYLVTPVGEAEANLGFDSGKDLRPNAHPCP